MDTGSHGTDDTNLKREPRSLSPAQTVFREGWKVWRKRHRRERTIQVSRREEAGHRLQRRAEGRRRQTPSLTARSLRREDPP